DLDALRALLKKAIDDETVPGVSLLVAHKGEVVFKEAFGNLKVDQAVRIASDTKPVVATVVAILADQGKLSLDDTLTKFVPEFKGTKVEKATIRQLLSHSAGVLNTAGGWPSATTLAEYSALIAKKGSLSEPGKFSYSGASIDLACRCAEKAGGQPFEA